MALRSGALTSKWRMKTCIYRCWWIVAHVLLCLREMSVRCQHPFFHWLGHDTNYKIDYRLQIVLFQNLLLPKAIFPLYHFRNEHFSRKCTKLIWPVAVIERVHFFSLLNLLYNYVRLLVVIFVVLEDSSLSERKEERCKWNKHDKTPIDCVAQCIIIHLRGEDKCE